MLLAAIVAAMAISLTANGPAPASGQDQPNQISAIPTATSAPGLLPCNVAPPYFTLTDNNPYVGAPVGWWAAGLQVNTQVVITVTDMLMPTNPASVYKIAAAPNNWCQASGTMSFPLPVQYMVEMTGTSSLTGQPVSIVTWPFPIPPIPATATPTPQVLPSSPTNVRATQLNGSSVRVDWAYAFNDETGFVVVGKTGQLQAPSNARTLTVGGLDAGQIYCFRVYAVNAVGMGPPDIDCVLLTAPTPGGP